jgi:hypothetical protein
MLISMAVILFTCAKPPRKVKLELKFAQGTKSDYTIHGKGNVMANIERGTQGKKSFQINFDGALSLKSEVKSVSPEGNGTIAMKLDKVTLNIDHTIPDVPEQYKKIAVEVDSSKIKVTDAKGAAIFDTSQAPPGGGINPGAFILPILAQEWVTTMDKTGKTIDFEIPPMLQTMVQQAQPGKDLKEGLKYAESAFPTEPVEVGKSYTRKFKIPAGENKVEEINVTYKVERVEPFEGMECALLITTFDMDLMKYIKKAIASAPMPLSDKSVLDKASVGMKITSGSFFALEKGYIPKSEGDITISGSFADPKQGKADLSCKIHFVTTEQRK